MKVGPTFQGRSPAEFEFVGYLIHSLGLVDGRYTARGVGALAEDESR